MNILASKKKPDDLSMVYFITLIAKYYLSDEIDAESLSKIVKEKLLEFDLENQNKNIENVCENIKLKNTLIKGNLIKTENSCIRNSTKKQ